MERGAFHVVQVEFLQILGQDGQLAQEPRGKGNGGTRTQRIAQPGLDTVSASGRVGQFQAGHFVFEFENALRQGLKGCGCGDGFPPPRREGVFFVRQTCVVVTLGVGYEVFCVV